MSRKMTTTEKQNVIQFELRERYCLQQILNQLKESRPEYNYTMYMSPIDSDTPYDAILTIKNFKDEVINTFIIEVKNRTNIYSNMYMEKRKMNSLNKAKTSLEMQLQRTCDILYINITDKCTFIFPISEMTLPKCTREEMASESFANTIVKRNKLVYSLPLKQAIKMKFKYDEVEYQKSIEPIKVVTQEKKVKTISLF